MNAESAHATTSNLESGFHIVKELSKHQGDPVSSIVDSSLVKPINYLKQVTSMKVAPGEATPIIDSFSFPPLKELGHAILESNAKPKNTDQESTKLALEICKMLKDNGESDVPSGFSSSKEAQEFISSTLIRILKHNSSLRMELSKYQDECADMKSSSQEIAEAIDESEAKVAKFESRLIVPGLSALVSGQKDGKISDRVRSFLSTIAVMNGYIMHQQKRIGQYQLVVICLGIAFVFLFYRLIQWL